jgi:hypothetical protein
MRNSISSLPPFVQSSSPEIRERISFDDRARLTNIFNLSEKSIDIVDDYNFEIGSTQTPEVL